MQRGFPEEINAFGLANTQDKREYEEYAGFGELTFEFLDDFAVTLGGRYLEYEISQFKEDWGFAFNGAGRDTANVTDRDDSENELHGKVTAAWHYQEASQVYATVSNGTRPGGFNRTVPVSDDPAEPIGFACQQALNGLGASATGFRYFRR
ncbi:MAG: TonB-dependent receptor [Halioglobus sp.]|nr:TonB-dependent receptor [Halioglobus sp.]